jgi:predicted dehydrogenase
LAAALDEVMKEPAMTLGVGIVGSGEMGLKYAEALARYTTGTRFVAVAGGTRAPSLAAEYGVAVTGVNLIIEHNDIDALVVATPHSTHVPIALAAAAAGKHLYMEKPLARTVAECDAIIEACERADVRLAVNAVTRFRPNAKAAHRAIAEGRIGRLRMIRVLSSAVGYSPDYKSWTSDPAEGGMWLDWGCHGADALRWFAGGDTREVFGFLTDFGGSGIDRTAMVQFYFDNGIAAQLLMCFEMPPPGIGSMSQWTLIGSRGVLELDGYGTVSLGTADGWAEISRQEPFDFINEPLAPHLIQGFADQLQDFIDAIDQGRPPVVDGCDGRASVSMVEAARTSSREHRAVSLPPERGTRRS